MIRPKRLNFSLLDQGSGALRPTCTFWTARRAVGLPVHIFKNRSTHV